jgi:WD40 repeat protein
VIPLTFLADGNRLVFASATERRLFDWDLVVNREIQSWPQPLGHITGSSISPDQRQLVMAGIEGDVSIRNLAEQSSTRPHLDFLEANGNGAFAPSGKLLAWPSNLGYARVWDTGSWGEVATLRGFLNAAESVAFSPDGHRLAASGGVPSDALKLWTVDSWQEVLTLHADGSVFGQAAFSPDGNALGVVTASGLLHVWQAPSWDQIAAAEVNQKGDSGQP